MSRLQSSVLIDKTQEMESIFPDQNMVSLLCNTTPCLSFLKMQVSAQNDDLKGNAKSSLSKYVCTASSNVVYKIWLQVLISIMSSSRSHCGILLRKKCISYSRLYCDKKKTVWHCTGEECKRMLLLKEVL